MSLYLQIVIANSLRQAFTYLPLEDEPLPAIGCRVRVPFRHSKRIGLVVDHLDDCDLSEDQLKPILEVLDDQPLLPNHLWQLGKWASDYYQHPPGDALIHLLPILFRQGRDNQIISRYWQKRHHQSDLIKGSKQIQTWQQLRVLPDGFSEAQLRHIGLAYKDIKPLIDRGALVSAPPRPQHVIAQINQAPLHLNEEQQQALQSIQSCSNDFACHLLHGVTGSGKTEVYLQLIEASLQAGQRVLILVPEIGLTHQLLERLQQRFHNRVLCLHSGLSPVQRLDAWQQASLGQADLILGTRSAVFTPIPDLGMIIIDEEHDQAFKQQEGFRYHGRDVAIKRAFDDDIPIILGSATPSLESLANAKRGRYHHHRLLTRAGKANQERYEIIDLRQQPVHSGISERLNNIMQQQLSAGHQVLLMLNRRGFSPSLQCQACGQTVDCPSCDASMTLHKHPMRVHCHHCDYRQPVPTHCPHCQAQQLRPLGSGTERIEEQLQIDFPAYPVYRIDRDSTSNKGSLETLLAEIHEGQPCILIGTQMLAKGHHFPHVTAAVIIDADSGLFCNDFRGAERLAQLIIQTAGRAGRTHLPGTAYIQTYQPDHPVISTLTTAGYRSFAEQELQHRQQAQLPPFGHLALFLVQSRYEQKAYQLLTWLQHQLQNPIYAKLTHQLQHFGPMPASMARLANQYRVQLQLQHPSRQHLQTLCRHLCLLLEQHPDSKKLRWSLDIDPQDMG